MPYTLPNSNVTTLEDLLTYQAQQVPILWPIILVLIYCVLLGSGFLYQDKKTGRGNLALWASIAGLITSTLAFILFLIPGLINIQTLTITILVAIVGVIWLIFSSAE